MKVIPIHLLNMYNIAPYDPKLWIKNLQKHGFTPQKDTTADTALTTAIWTRCYMTAVQVNLPLNVYYYYFICGIKLLTKNVNAIYSG